MARSSRIESEFWDSPQVVNWPHWLRWNLTTAIQWLQMQSSEQAAVRIFRCSSIRAVPADSQSGPACRPHSSPLLPTTATTFRSAGPALSEVQGRMTRRRGRTIVPPTPVVCQRSRCCHVTPNQTLLLNLNVIQRLRSADDSGLFGVQARRKLKAVLGCQPTTDN